MSTRMGGGWDVPMREGRALGAGRTGKDSRGRERPEGPGNEGAEAGGGR